MGDQQQGDILFAEIMFQPFHHLDIQVVGRLIHDQQHMLVLKPDVDQGPGQGHPFTLSAAEGIHPLVEIADLEPAEDLLYFGIKVPGAQFVHFQDGIALPGMVIGFHGGLIFADGVHDRVLVEKYVPQYRFLFVEIGFLFKQGDVDILVDPYLALVRMIGAGEYPEQGGLAAAVACDERDLVTLGNMKGKA
jgi:hypothetical protein